MLESAAGPAGPALELRNDVEPATWDRALAALGGHPLQSALWGEARRAADGIRDYRWMALSDGVPQWMIRVEERRLPLSGWVGWAPRGPTGLLSGGVDLPAELRRAPTRAGMVLLVTDRWEVQEADGDGRPQATRPQTIWVDLTIGLEALWKGLDSRTRWGVGRARRDNVTIDTSAGPEDLVGFYSLCDSVAKAKEFHLPASVALMEKLLLHSGSDAEARLFLARYDGAIAAGAFIIRCGRSVHYLWGATDRAAARTRAGEAVQWAVMEWAMAQGCTRYDLEGIDPEENPGTYAFKKKMGGTEVMLAGKRYYPLGVQGRVAAWLDTRERLRRRLLGKV